MVGERGPEMIIPQSAGHVLTASQTSNLMNFSSGGAGGSSGIGGTGGAGGGYLSGCVDPGAAAVPGGGGGGGAYGGEATYCSGAAGARGELRVYYAK